MLIFSKSLIAAGVSIILTRILTASLLIFSKGCWIADMDVDDILYKSVSSKLMMDKFSGMRSSSS